MKHTSSYSTADSVSHILEGQIENLVSTCRKLRYELADLQERKQPAEYTESRGSYSKDTHHIERFVDKAIQSYTQGTVHSGSKRSTRRETPEPVERELRADRSSLNPGAATPGGNRRDHLTRHAIPVDIPEFNEPTLRFHKPDRRRRQDYGRLVGDEAANTKQSDKSASQPSQPSQTLTVHSESQKDTRQLHTQSAVKLNRGDSGSGLPNQSAHNDGSHPHSPIEERSGQEHPLTVSKHSLATELEGSPVSHSGSAEEDPGPYMPMAPFGGPGSRRRPRRPRPQSPIE